MSKMRYECGAFFDEPEYIVYDLYNYKSLPRRCYKREDHFKEVLAQFQGSEGKILPPEILDKIRAEIRDLSDTNVSEIRKILRKLCLTKYVENAQSIAFALTGVQPPYIKRVIQEKMIKLFKQIVSAWASVCCGQSFPNYYYVVYKLLELMDEIELMCRVPLLRTPLRIRRHDKVWAKICDELGWTYMPTHIKCQIKQKKASRVDRSTWDKKLHSIPSLLPLPETVEKTTSEKLHSISLLKPLIN